ncbi:MAG: selenocysteine-specific translation elongation factor [Bacteroidota bacterium]
MKHLIIGTAGHVDHGKTALIKALTNVDCDTHKEEKRRGITINLGFTYLNLPSGDPVGIIDVPGHKDFIHTMVSGASGIDLALLVIAADSGIMPQTVEHFNILGILGIKRGIIVLNKIDLVEEDLIKLAKDEIKSLVINTFLENAPIAEVSSVTGKGIPELKEVIAMVASEVAEREKGNFFRMFIDRIFTVKGFGSVITGTVINGEIDNTKKAFLLPGNKKEIRIRNIERYGVQTDKVVAGDRAAINVVGIEKNDFNRGMIISDSCLLETYKVDANIHLFKNSSRLNLWSQVIFHSGTYESQAKIHLIDKDELTGGENALVQIHLDKPCILMHGDRFVIRNTSSEQTLGGGEIVDAAPLVHRKRPQKLVESMSKLAEGSITELIRIEVLKKLIPVKADRIALSINKSSEEITNACIENEIQDVEKYITPSSILLIETERDKKFYSRVIGNIKSYHTRNPIFPNGLSTDELLSKLGLSDIADGEHYLEHLLKKIEKDGHIKKKSKTWILSDHKPAIEADVKYQIDLLESMLLDYGMQTPLISEIEIYATKNRIQKDQLKQYLKYMVNDRRLYFIEDNYIHAKIVDECRIKLLKELNKDNKGITIAEFRNIVGGNRKICLLLMALYDAECITLRKDDLRYITDKGRKLL